MKLNYLKVGTIDGLAFDKSRSHQCQSQRGGYNNMRSHGLAIMQLAYELGLKGLSFSTDTGDSGLELAPGDDMNYVLANFDRMELSECTHTDPAKYGILVQTLVSKEHIHRLEQFVDSVDHLYIYSSDYEYELRENTFNKPFLFEFMRNPFEGYEYLVEKIKAKLVVAFCGWYHIAKITAPLLGINTEFIPQLINPKIPTFRLATKVYDGFFMGMDERTVEFMKKSGDMQFISIQYRDFSVDHKEYRNVTQVQQAGICTDIKTLTHIASLAKFHCITNSWKKLYPGIEQNSDMFVNQTFKIFEAYYAGMYPINPAQNWDAAVAFMSAPKSQYEVLLSSFIYQMESNYSFKRYLPTINKWAHF